MFISEWFCSSQGTADRKTLSRYRSLYRGDRQTTIQCIRRRFINDDLTVDSSESSAEPDRNFSVENELAVILNQRIEAVPLGLDFVHDDEELQQEIRDWAAGNVTREGLSFYALQHLVRRDQERDGMAAIVAWKSPDGKVMLAVRDTSTMELHTDRMTGEVVRAIFRVQFTPEVKEGEPAETLEIVEVYDSTNRTLRVPGEEDQVQPHGLNEVPLVLIPRTIEYGQPVGVSGVAELEEAYLAYLMAWHYFDIATKLEAHGVYCPTDATGPMLRESGSPLTGVRITPGGLFPAPIQKVGGSIIVDAYEKQLDRKEAVLYRLGRVRRKSETSMVSGKAMIIDTREMQDYVVSKLVTIRMGYERIADMWAAFMGKVPAGQSAGFSIEAPEVEDDDPAEQTKRGDLFLKAAPIIGLSSIHVLTAWQRLGLIDEDADIEAMAQEIDEKAEADEESSMLRAAAALAAQETQPVPPQEDDEEPGVMEPEVPADG